MTTRKQLQEIHDYFQWQVNQIYYNEMIPTESIKFVEAAYRDAMLKICPLIECNSYLKMKENKELIKNE
tara:strand:+ start:258 stop:464 length:207 start_codon:yes stop_codon:yes gene_type:complete